MPTLGINEITEVKEIYEKLNKTFTDQGEQEKVILEAREILRESGKDLTNNQILDLVNEVQYLVDTWLEEFEKSIFDGKTLNELLRL